LVKRVIKSAVQVISANDIKTGPNAAPEWQAESIGGEAKK
jgi:hypothetical protein